MPARVLVVYASFAGSTREIAERIGTSLASAGLEVVTRDAAIAPDIEGYDAFVIGSAIHGGRWLDAAETFARRNAANLARRPVWLFSVGPIGTNPRYRAAEPAAVAELQSVVSARDHRVFAGAHDRHHPALNRLGLAARVAAKTLLPEGDFRDWDEIETWATAIARDVARQPAPAG